MGLLDMAFGLLGYWFIVMHQIVASVLLWRSIEAIILSSAQIDAKPPDE